MIHFVFIDHTIIIPHIMGPMGGPPVRGNIIGQGGSVSVSGLVRLRADAKTRRVTTLGRAHATSATSVIAGARGEVSGKIKIP